MRLLVHELLVLTRQLLDLRLVLLDFRGLSADHRRQTGKHCAQLGTVLGQFALFLGHLGQSGGVRLHAHRAVVLHREVRHETIVVHLARRAEVMRLRRG